ncbi:MAG: hypothetical protein ACP5GJ_03005 [Nanopusillaceae archaeon]|jgi:hypothetical protein
MKGQSWIEVLITLSIFIYVFIYLFNGLIKGINYYSIGISELLSYQKLYLASFYFSKYPNNTIVYNYINVPFSYSLTPSVVFVQSQPYYCNDCIEIYYNIYNGEINIIQNAPVNLSSYISFFVFSNNANLSKNYSNSYISCTSYYSISIYGLQYRSLKYCNSYIYGNGSINITTNDNILFVTNYLSLLKLYNGNKLIASPRIVTLTTAPTASLYYFQYINDSIDYIDLYT